MLVLLMLSMLTAANRAAAVCAVKAANVNANAANHATANANASVAASNLVL